MLVACLDKTSASYRNVTARLPDHPSKTILQGTRVNIYYTHTILHSFMSKQIQDTQSFSFLLKCFALVLVNPFWEMWTAFPKESAGLPIQGNARGT